MTRRPAISKKRQRNASAIDLRRLSDAALIARCIEDHQVAWRELIERHGPLVYSISRRSGLSNDDCDDVFQEVWANAIRQLPQLRDQQSLPKWLIVTTMRITWKAVRRAGAANLNTTEICDPDATPPEQLAQWERHALVHASLRELGGRCEELLRALYLDSNASSYHQLARRLAMPVGSIGPTRARCLQKLLAIVQRRSSE